MVQEGAFRLDLYYRINVFPIHIPSLAERQEDIPQLVMHLLQNINKKLYITQPALQLILSHTFPGNIRQLKNLLTRASILSDTNVVDEQQIKESMAMDSGITSLESSSAEKFQGASTLKSNEAGFIAELVDQHGGDKKAAAKELGISLRTLYRKLEG